MFYTLRFSCLPTVNDLKIIKPDKVGSTDCLAVDSIRGR